MGRLLLIDVVASVAVLGTWYFVFSHYNRKKGAAALRWVQTACAGRGRILESRWMGTSRLEARLHFPARWFDNVLVTVKFRPRPLPIQWLMSCWRKQKETLTFEADLDSSPSFRLEVVRHRWCAHNRGISSRKGDDREWDVYEPGPVILTTRTHWKQDPVCRIECADVGAAAGCSAGSLPPGVATILCYGSSGISRRPKHRSRVCQCAP